MAQTSDFSAGSLMRTDVIEVKEMGDENTRGDECFHSRDQIVIERIQ